MSANKFAADLREWLRTQPEDASVTVRAFGSRATTVPVRKLLKAAERAEKRTYSYVNGVRTRKPLSVSDVCHYVDQGGRLDDVVGLRGSFDAWLAANPRSKRAAAVTRSPKPIVQSRSDPPHSAEFLLHLALPLGNQDEQIGDLEERFRTRILPKFGLRRARFWYWFKAFSLVRHALKLRVIELVAKTVVGWH